MRPRTTGYRQHQALYVRGRGHWLGTALYNTGHDHGGGTNYGFATRRFTVPPRAGENEVVVQFASFFNVTFNWAGFALREITPER